VKNFYILYKEVLNPHRIYPIYPTEFAPMSTEEGEKREEGNPLPPVWKVKVF